MRKLRDETPKRRGNVGEADEGAEDRAIERPLQKLVQKLAAGARRTETQPRADGYMSEDRR